MEEEKLACEKAKKDLSAVEKHCEMEIAQMTRVMGDYKKEYDGVFMAKDNEIQQLKLELETLNKQVIVSLLVMLHDTKSVVNLNISSHSSSRK